MQLDVAARARDERGRDAQGHLVPARRGREVEPPARIPVHGHHQAGLVQLIVELRAKGYLITASCDFEEWVAKETGWNWSTETTEPPGRAKV